MIVVDDSYGGGMNLHPMSAHLDSLAWHIDRFGYDAITQQQLMELRRPAEEAGIRQALIELLADESAPAPVRNRAFGRVSSFLAAHIGRERAVAVTDDQVACAA